MRWAVCRAAMQVGDRRSTTMVIPSLLDIEFEFDFFISHFDDECDDRDVNDDEKDGINVGRCPWIVMPTPIAVDNADANIEALPPSLWSHLSIISTAIINIIVLHTLPTFLTLLTLFTLILFLFLVSFRGPTDTVLIVSQLYNGHSRNTPLPTVS